MKHLAAIAIAGAFAIMTLSVGLTPAKAAGLSNQTDFSSAQQTKQKTKKKTYKRSRHYKRGYSYNRGYGGYNRSYGYGGGYGSYGYGGYPAPYRSFAADPSFDPSGRPYQPSVYSPCQIDLGYGRFTSCDR